MRGHQGLALVRGVLVAMMEAQSLIPRSHMMEERTDTQKFASFVTYISFPH